MSLLGSILWNCIRFPRRLAVVDDRREYRYAQIGGGAMFIADEIERVTEREHVGILLPTSGMFPMALLGSWLARRVAVPLNYLLAHDELRYVIHDSDIDTIITAGPMLDAIGGREIIPDGIKLVLLEELEFKGVPPLRWPPRYDDDDVAVILYTSGTSGHPKGVLLTHGNFKSNVIACMQHINVSSANGFLGVLPQFHSFGLTAMTLLPLYVGAKVVYTARFVPRRLVELIKKHRPEVFMAVPSMYGALLTVKSAEPADFQSLRFAVSGGEPLPDAIFEAVESRFGLRLLEGYGLTETTPVANVSLPEQWKRHSVGPTLPGVTAMIVGDDDKPLPTGEDGEILFAGPNIMKGYYKLPDETARAFVQLPHPETGEPTRFFRTGDIGHVDEDGLLSITGRKKEMLIIGGENVFPREIEEVLNQHESVHAAAVIGKLDGIRGEVPIAFVEMVEGCEFDEVALRNWCRDSLATFKVPREIRQMDQLPRNPTGKIMRRQLSTD